mmetsp:Transcript_64428/g.185141  ORF Transcript_64428/g.185141 Transcript_64428/m.185141 type:complete len:232 (-) Transcript_64428:199-894(-)
MRCADASPREELAGGLPPAQQCPRGEHQVQHRAADALGPRLQERLQSRVVVQVLEAEELQGAAPLSADAQALAEALDLLRDDGVHELGDGCRHGLRRVNAAAKPLRRGCRIALLEEAVAQARPQGCACGTAGGVPKIARDRWGARRELVDRELRHRRGAASCRSLGDAGEPGVREQVRVHGAPRPWRHTAAQRAAHRPGDAARRRAVRHRLHRRRAEGRCASRCQARGGRG